jgi:hypothetical protein
MSVIKNSLRGGVITKWDSLRKPDWSIEQTLQICTDVNNELETARFNPAPRFREAIKSHNQPYLINWVQGCRFPWLNPR